MAIHALSSGMSVAAGLNDTGQGSRGRREEDPLTFLTPSDWRLVSHAVGFVVDPRGKLFPLLAFQIGWDRRSGVLAPHQNVSIGYLQGLADSYGDTDRDGALGMQDQIAAGIAYLRRCAQDTDRLDIRA